MAGYEILEHTADVGIRSWGRTLEEAFEQAAAGLADVLGARAEGTGDPGRLRRVRAEAADPAALLVGFLNELLLVHETEEVALGPVEVLSLSETDVDAVVEVAPLEGEPEGTPVKAATYHQLEVVARTEGGAEVRVFLDV